MKLYLSILLTLIGITSVYGFDVVSRSPEGELSITNITENAEFTSVIAELQSNYGSNGEFLLDFMAAAPQKLASKAATLARDYNHLVTPTEKNDIAYIINTMGMSSLISIAAHRQDLKDAGARVDHIHPLRWLQTIFTDDQMKTSLHAMRNRGWIWGEFFNGTKNSLEEESARNNMKPEYIQDFARNVNIDPALITPSIQARNWEQFIQILIDKIPRNDDSDRYDM